MVTDDDDDGVVTQIRLFEGFYYLAQPVVEIRDIAIISMASLTDSFLTDMVFTHGGKIMNPLAMGVEILVVHGWNVWHINGIVIITIPIALTRCIRVMGVSETGHQHERTLIATPRKLINLADALITGFVIKFQLVGCLSDTGLGDAGKVMTPPVYALVLGFPIRCPTKIRRIDVRRQAFFKAVHLIWADKMHLTGQASLITHIAQVMGKCRNAGRKFRGIVIAANT